MLTNSIPKLLQEANEVKQALAAIGAGLPPEISAAGMEARVTELEAVISELDAVNADRTRLVNLKRGTRPRRRAITSSSRGPWSRGFSARTLRNTTWSAERG
jgi:hypothetical protein